MVVKVTQASPVFDGRKSGAIRLGGNRQTQCVNPDCPMFAYCLREGWQRIVWRSAAAAAAAAVPAASVAQVGCSTCGRSVLVSGSVAGARRPFACCRVIGICNNHTHLGQGFCASSRVGPVALHTDFFMARPASGQNLRAVQPGSPRQEV